jgi:hypothetical protein
MFTFGSDMTLNNEIPCNPYDPYVLVEGPRWGDAEFYGKWLLAAHRANSLWKRASEDVSFAKRVERLEVVCVLDLAMAATGLLLELRGQFFTFMIRVDSEEAELFAMLASMGFFARTGERYQMVIPNRLTLATVKNALLRLARTEDGEFMLHPEDLVTTVTFVEAKAWQERQREMDEDHRNADRLVLLERSRIAKPAANWRNWYKDVPILRQRSLLH